MKWSHVILETESLSQDARKIVEIVGVQRARICAWLPQHTEEETIDHLLVVLTKLHGARLHMA